MKMSSHRRQRISLTVAVATGFLYAICCASAWAKFDAAKVEIGVVRIMNGKLQNNNFKQMSYGTGFMINDQGYVVTNNHVVHGAEALVVHISGSTAFKVADLIHKWPDVDLALLRVQGLPAATLRLAKNSPPKGAPVFALGFPGIAEKNKGFAAEATLTTGIVGRVFTGMMTSKVIGIVQHSAQVNPGNSGGPLFDDCGRVVGVNTQSALAGKIIRDDQGRVIDVMAGQGVFFASQSAVLIELLRQASISFTEDASTCVPPAPGPDQEARERAQKAAEAAGGAARRADQAREAASSAAKRANQAREEASAAGKGAQDAKRAADDAKRAADAAKQGAESLMQQLSAWAARATIWAVLLTLLVAAGVVAMFRRPRQAVIRWADEQSKVLRRRASEIASNFAAQTGGRDGSGLAAIKIIMTGFSMSGHPLRFELAPGILVGARDGVCIGRQSELVDVVLDAPDFSRRHARFRIENGRMVIEDLNSTNGTTLNGRRLQPFRSSPITVGDRIGVGGIELTAFRG